VTAGLGKAPAPIGVVVVNYGSHELIAGNLGPVDLRDVPARVVVVDNWSTAAERTAVRALCAQHGWELVPLADNRGFGAAVNAGTAAARSLGCTSFLLLNPDAAVTAEVVAELREHSLREPLALITPRIVDSAGRGWFEGATVELARGRTRGARSPRPARGRSFPWVTGACVALSAELDERLGGMAESYFLYWEDVDLSYRTLQAGGRVVVREDLVAVHDEGGTQGRSGRAKSPLYYRYNCRNRLLFAARHLSRRDLLRWLVTTPAESWDVLMRGGRRQLLTAPGLAFSALRGSLAGAGAAVAALLGRRPERRPAMLVAHPGAELYGSDRVLLESVQALQRYADVVVTVPGDGPLVAELRARGVRVVRCPAPVLRKSALRPRGLLRLLADGVRHLPSAVRLVATAGRSGVYVNTVTIPSWLVLGRLLGRPVTCHVHEAEQSAGSLVRRALAAPVRLATRVVVNSRFSEDVLLAAAPALRDRTVVVYNGVPGPSSIVPARPALSGAVRLLFIGRLSPRKGPQVALAAARALVAEGIDVQLQLLGSVFPGYEWFEAELRAGAASGELAGRVEFLGFRADIWPDVAAADVVLVPSQVDEPFGNTAVEAVLAGRPLVVSDTSGLREASAGYASVVRVPPADVAAWVAAVRGLVAAWPAPARAAVEDAQEAARRHAPSRYRDSLVDAVLGPGARP
jgi:GT2 family glycosyltransferase